jgi:hypothetical protein
MGVFLLIVGSVIHFIRDILQFASIHILLSTLLVKTPPARTTSLLWHPLNTILIEVLMLILTFRILKRNSFGIEGKVTILGASLTLFGFLYYWFFL